MQAIIVLQLNSQVCDKIKTLIIHTFLAGCYVVAKVYKVLYTDPPCRIHVHMFTIIQFLRARANIHTVVEG